MKYTLILFLLFLSFYVNGQLQGNGNMITAIIPLEEEFTSIDVGLVAEYEIDLSAEPSLEITIDENLIEFVEKSVKGKTLTIGQLKWISSNGNVVIRIGGKGVTKVSQSSYSQVLINNIDQETLNINVEVGDMILEGVLKDLKISVGTGTVDAEKVNVERAEFGFESWGTIRSAIEGKITSNSKEKGKLYVDGKLVGKKSQIQDEGVKFIKFTLKNNSANRHEFYVVGPKPDGSTFSYGFPMMPYQKRDKDWTNGTTVYKVNRLGIRTLVKTISLSDEGEIVDIFSK